MASYRPRLPCDFRSSPNTATIGGSRALETLVIRLQQEQDKQQLMLLDHLTDAASFPMAASSNAFGPSPTNVMATTPPDQYFAHSHYAGSSTNSGKGNTPSNNMFGNPFAAATLTPNASNLPTPGSLAGRKRSRGDINADEEEMEPDGSLPTPASEPDLQPTKPRGPPITGEGMTLIYPGDPSYPASAESQSGTWLEENAARKPFQLNQLKRPSFSARKSQRMDASASGPDDLAQLVLPASMREVTEEPLIDEATRKLGISWTRMDSSEARQINQAAYAKFIINHYAALREVVVWFENSALPGYLVQCLNVYKGEREFYIFSHDLVEGRLVTRDPADLIPRLLMLPQGLHIAAPGGCIRAEMDAATVSQNEINNYVHHEAVQAGMIPAQPAQAGAAESITTSVAEPLAPEGVCSAHSMELD